MKGKIRKIRKKLALLGVAAVAGFALVTAGPVGDANAARAHYFYHSATYSQSGSILVYHSWNCTGTGWDWVPRGSEAEVDVGSVWIPKGYSWWVRVSGHYIRWYSQSTTKARCGTMTSWPSTSMTMAMRSGNNWGSG
jgi:hypothetical protein